MTDEKKLPIWVLLAFSSTRTRKASMILIACSVLFTIYCVPWSTIFSGDAVKTLFLIDDWSWVAMMIPITGWYVISLKWLDNNDAWSKMSD